MRVIIILDELAKQTSSLSLTVLGVMIPPQSEVVVEGTDTDKMMSGEIEFTDELGRAHTLEPGCADLSGYTFQDRSR